MQTGTVICGLQSCEDCAKEKGRRVLGRAFGSPAEWAGMTIIGLPADALGEMPVAHRHSEGKGMVTFSEVSATDVNLHYIKFCVWSNFTCPEAFLDQSRPK